MRLAVSAAALAAVVLGLVAACGGGGGDSAPLVHPAPGGPPPWGTSAAGAPACGMSMFVEPACEAALDNGCCTQQQACASDRDCASFMRCWNFCEVKRREMKARNEPGGCDCFNNCAGGNLNAPGLRFFGAVANCSKNIHYPEGMECRSGC